jgi:uncharacterized protein (TIGR03083 family)
VSAEVNVVEARERVELLGEVWASTIDLLDTLDGDEWELPTDCPGWTVKDQAAHVIGVESMFGGAPQPDVEPREWPHVRSDMGRALEAWVEVRRGDPPAEVLRDLRAITAQRLAMFRGFDDAGWAGETFTPAGPGTFADLVPFRVFDSWSHEQDIRRAVGRPGGFDTPAGRWAVAWCTRPLGRAVSKVDAPEGTTIEWLGYGPPVEVRHRVELVNGRGETVDVSGAAPPTVRITTDVVSFVRLCLGRVDPAAALAANLVRFRGDADLGREVVHRMAFTP